MIQTRGSTASEEKLKGVAGNLSLVHLRTDIDPLVEELRRGSLENAEEFMKPVAADYDAVIAALGEN